MSLKLNFNWITDKHKQPEWLKITIFLILTFQVPLFLLMIIVNLDLKEFIFIFLFTNFITSYIISNKQDDILSALIMNILLSAFTTGAIYIILSKTDKQVLAKIDVNQTIQKKLKKLNIQRINFVYKNELITIPIKKLKYNCYIFKSSKYFLFDRNEKQFTSIYYDCFQKPIILYNSKIDTVKFNENLLKNLELQSNLNKTKEHK